MGAKLCQSTFGRLKSPISQIVDGVCSTISKDLIHLGCAGQIHGACSKHLSKLTLIQQNSAGPRSFHSELNSDFSSEERAEHTKIITPPPF